MTPSENEVGSRGGTSENQEISLALRPSRGIPLSGGPEVIASSSSTFVKPREPPSGPESCQPLTAGSSSLSKPGSSPNFPSQSHESSSIGSRGSSPSTSAYNTKETHKQTIVRSFAPRVAVFASSDTEDFVKDKGFEDGLYSLLRPYGERLIGKVVIRDSIGGSRGWDDFGIRFMDSGALQKDSAHRASSNTADPDSRNLVTGVQHERINSSYSDDQTGTSIDRLIDSYLHSTGATSENQEKRGLDFDSAHSQPRPKPSPLYLVYLRKLLSSAPIVPYETFSHPVACLIAVSSRHTAPIEALRKLYSQTSHGGERLPAWLGTEYLRYYVLIHDEENDDITKSTALFDLMKRHFGLHCHLLRLRRSQCVLTDDDCTRVPSCEWLSAEEEIEKLCMRDYPDDVGLSEKCIFESDSTAIKSFLREMVTQSIVPFMEGRVVTWNDQVASRRRGISGRFMSLSKRWTGFSAAKSTTSSHAGLSNPSRSNYDYQQAFYPPEAPESTMRQLGDYAFMLRDWKLAYSIYDLLRGDYAHDKAWTYHAAANEMAAITSLLIPHASNSRSRSELVDQMLDTAAYSYLTRCSLPFNANRCLTIAMELLKTRGPTAAGDAARWGAKVLELGVLTPGAQALATERIAECYMSRASDTCKRQAALWSLLASESWLRLDQWEPARIRLCEASALYALDGQDNVELPFPSMRDLWQRLELALREAAGGGYTASAHASMSPDNIEANRIEEKEQLNMFTTSSIPSMIDTEGFTSQVTGHPIVTSFKDPRLQNNGFE